MPNITRSTSGTGTTWIRRAHSPAPGSIIGRPLLKLCPERRTCSDLKVGEGTLTALDCGADLVLGFLSASFPPTTQGVFANAAVDILAKTGIVTHISFGVESPEWQMDKILDILIEEPQPFKFSLKEELDKGSSFVESRAAAANPHDTGHGGKTQRFEQLPCSLIHAQDKETKLENRCGPGKEAGIGISPKTSLLSFSSATAVRKAIAAGKVSEALSRL